MHASKFICSCADIECKSRADYVLFESLNGTEMVSRFLPHVSDRKEWEGKAYKTEHLPKQVQLGNKP